jgi:signal transduction histidine kinase/ligand-binding sensor domain-containing protein
LLVCAALLCDPSALALDPALDVSQYAHTAWRVRDGFTKGAIFAIAQTPDGYLWLGTESGLVRFDGVRAVPWQSSDGEQLPNNFINALLVARDGTLWIGTHNGLASWKDGKLTQYAESAGLNVRGILQDREGTLWIGAAGATTGNLCAARGGSLECQGAGNFGREVNALYEDHKGNVWVSGQSGLWRWKPGTHEHYSLPREVTWIHGLTEDNSGSILLCTDKGLAKLTGGKIESYALPSVTGQFQAVNVFQSSDGSLWVSTWQGLLHFHQGRTDVFKAVDGLSADFVTPIFEDREGNIWVGTQDGLDRFRDVAVPTISRKQGLEGSAAWSVQAIPDGSIWIVTAGGLNQWKNGHVTFYRSRTALGQSGQKDEQEIGSGAAREIVNSGLTGNPRSMGQDRGRLWASTGDGVFYFENGRFIRVPGVPGGHTNAIVSDASGNIWISDPEGGLFCLTPELTAKRTPWSQFGHRLTFALQPDRLGGLWLGFQDGGVAYFKDGQVRASYTAADGLGKGDVSNLQFDSHGTLWAATQGGLSYIKDGRIATLTSKNGLPCDAVHWLIEDDDHAFWLYKPCGLVRIARSELDAWMNDSTRVVQFTTLGVADGVRSPELPGGYPPMVTKSSDGRIWFLPRDGVSVVDPHHLAYNKLPPPVHIEQITADRKLYDVASKARGGLRLPPLVRDLKIDYTALSLAVPEKVHFRFKLEGQDQDWREVVNDRQVQYSNLAPKNYRFRVTACNNSGVWNEEGAFLDFSISPAYYQTNWFRALCMAAFLALLWAVYQLRLRQVTREFNMRLDERVNERTRIARELHDTLLQSFQGQLMRFQAVSNELAGGELKQELDEAIDGAARAITEGRDAVQGLRSSVVESNDLAAAIVTLGKELAASRGRSPEFTVRVEGAPRDLHPILRDEVYRVAGEALRNTFYHADAQRIEVEIRYDERQFRLRVRDDGKGIDPKALGDSGRAGHFGLRGMRERAKLVGGELKVWSELESGTEVELRIPALHAYAAFRAPRRRLWLTEKLFGKDHEMKS